LNIDDLQASKMQTKVCKGKKFIMENFKILGLYKNQQNKDLKLSKAFVAMRCN
jgi:hypothetical protein